MPTFTLTGVKVAYNRPAFLTLVLQWVTTDITLANQYVDAVIAGQSRTMVVPGGQLGIIATELDLAGVICVATWNCTGKAANYNRAAFISTIKKCGKNTAEANQFATDVENGQARQMTGGPPQIIATELDFAGVVWNAL